MLCYRDRTWCNQPLDKCTCDPYFKITPEVLEDAKKWWGGMDGEPPFCTAKLCNPTAGESILKGLLEAVEMEREAKKNTEGQLIDLVQDKFKRVGTYIPDAFVKQVVRALREEGLL